jgi:short-subunit dehydrogenase
MNKLIVATGGTRGIGRAILEKFAQGGFDVATCARTQADLEVTKSALEKAYRSRVFIHTADVSSKSQAKGFSEFVAGLNRPVDVLVNNAGHFIAGEITEEPEGSLESMINSHVYSAYYITRGLVQGMKERRQGHIFTMCSIASIAAYPNGGSYTIAKFALLGFSKVLREELKEFGVRVTAVLPGATKTASWDGTDLPDERFMKAEDVADAVYAAYSLSGRSVVEEMIIRPQLGDI